MTKLHPRPLRSISDEELVAKIRSSNIEAETELVDRFSRGLMILLARIAPRNAEDLHQETFQVTLERLRQRGIDEPSKIDRFILGVARKLAASSRRNALRAKTIDNPELVQAIKDEGPGPLQRITAARNTQCIRQLLSEMKTERDREILYRFYVKGNSKAQICAQLNLDPIQFNRVLHRARTRFKALVLDKRPDDMEFDL